MAFTLAQRSMMGRALDFTAVRSVIWESVQIHAIDAPFCAAQ
jgi:hypothetical protein